MGKSVCWFDGDECPYRTGWRCFKDVTATTCRQCYRIGEDEWAILLDEFFSLEDSRLDGKDIEISGDNFKEIMDLLDTLRLILESERIVKEINASQDKILFWGELPRLKNLLETLRQLEIVFRGQ